MSFNAQDKIPLMNSHKPLCAILPPIINLLLGMFYVGYCIAYISIYDPKVVLLLYGLDPDGPHSSLYTGVINSCIFLAAALGALLSTLLLKYFSRRNTVLVLNGVAALGGLLLVSYNSVWLLLGGRLIQGATMGGLSSVIPLIVKEYSPKELSGTTGSLNNLWIIIGVIGANAYHAAVGGSEVPSGLGWRCAIGWVYALLALQSALLLGPFRYETPKYYLQQADEEMARSVLEHFYQEEYIPAALEEKLQDMKEAAPSSQPSTPGFRRRLVVALTLPVAQQATGVNILVVYISSIFSFNAALSKYIGTAVNILQMFTNLSTGALLMRLGRKQILLAGLGVICVCNVLLGVGFMGED
jgi:SP family facilitated glucose transporter-like MFS transporter 3